MGFICAAFCLAGLRSDKRVLEVHFYVAIWEINCRYAVNGNKRIKKFYPDRVLYKNLTETRNTEHSSVITDATCKLSLKAMP